MALVVERTKADEAETERIAPLGAWLHRTRLGFFLLLFRS
jgi:hypothetical protein